MFGTQFYPTPKAVVRKMAEPYLDKLAGKTIFDPGAGSGSIYDFVTEEVASFHVRRLNERFGEEAVSEFRYRRRDFDPKIKFYCMELDNELNAMLRGKGYNVIGDDFLEYNGRYRFDYIFMNPPFVNGIKHLLHAWEVASDGCVIRCLLNAANFESRAGQPQLESLLRLIESHGSRENLGRVFEGDDVSRIADVDVEMVTLNKPEKAAAFEFNWEPPKDRVANVDHSIGGMLASSDYLEAFERSYNLVIDAFDTYLEAAAKISYYGSSFNQVMYHKPESDEDDGKKKASSPKRFISILKMALDAYEDADDDAGRMNSFINTVKRCAWMEVFEKTKLKELATSSVRENFQKYAEEQGMQEFTRDNVLELIDMLFMNRKSIMQSCLVEVFDNFRKFHKDNAEPWGAWKTNDAYRVKMKIIMPYFVKQCEYTKTFELRYNRTDEMMDIDRVMCSLTGKKIENAITMKDALGEKFKRIGAIYPNDPFDNELESEFFRLKFFKKGTLHIWFKDKSLNERFNLQAAAGKNWLPGE